MDLSTINVAHEAIDSHNISVAEPGPSVVVAALARYFTPLCSRSLIASHSIIL